MSVFSKTCAQMINKIAQGDVNIFSQLTCFFSILICFATLTGNDTSNRLNIIRFVNNILVNNKIAQVDVNIFSQLTCFFQLTFFATLTGNDASNRLNIIIFLISRPTSVEKDTSHALF